MRSSIDTIGCDVHLDHRVGAHAEVLGSGCTYLDTIGIQQDDTTIVMPYADLHLTAEHAEALYATDLALLDGEGLIARA